MMLDGLKTLRRLVAAAAVEVFQPTPKLTVSQWADANRLLPSTSAEPGRFRTDRIPYLRKIQDTLGDETVGAVVFAKAAQVAGSTAGENFVGFLIDHSPCAILEVWPTEKKLNAWSLTRLDPMLQETPSLAKKFPRSRRREAGNSIDKKLFPGGWLMAITAKSTSDLKSSSARVAIAEEVDEWEGDVGDQGDPLALLRVRLRTFWNAKLFIVSTPTIDGYSRVWRELEDSTWNEFWVPCPECGEYQTLRWRDGDENPDDAGDYRIVWDKDEEGRVIRGSTKYVCVHGCLVDERHKQRMLEGGEWRERHPGRPTVGFHINTIYSPLCRWDTIAEEFAKAKKNPEEMKTFVNTFLGLPYREKGDSINAHFLASREESYPTEGEGENAIELIPAGVGLLTAGVDVQGDRIEMLIWGWGAGEERWLIAWEVLNGDPGHAEVWQQLERRRLLQRPHESGATLAIAAMCVDAGFQTDHVHAFCAPRNSQNVLAVIGKEGAGRPLLQAPEREKYKRSAKSKKRPTHMVGSDSGKSAFFSALRLKEPGPRYVHFPSSVDPVIYDHFTSERLVTEYRRGRAQRVWKKIEHRANEGLDMANYATAALMQLGPKTRSRLAEIVAEVNARGALMKLGRSLPAPPARGRRILSRGIT
jgi:phage terminase large subunit GpA-like protein